MDGQGYVYRKERPLLYPFEITFKGIVIGLLTILT